MKAKLSDTFHVLLPKNRSIGISKHQQVDIQIPKSEWVLNLQKAYISVELKLEAKISAAYTADDFIGTLNSACIFDQVSLNHGRTIYTDTFCQVNSRIWQMSKSDSYLKANYASFANWSDMSINEGFTAINVRKLTTGFKEYTLRMRIPLPCLFNCFDECDEFPTSMLNDNITLSMQLSDIHKWMCFMDHGADKLAGLYSFTGNTFKCSSAKVIEINDSESSYYINDIKLVCPAHYPSIEEMELNRKLIEEGVWCSPFRSCDIQAQTIDFFNAGTRAVNFSTNANNIFGVFVLVSSNNNYCAYNRPNMKMFTQLLFSSLQTK